MLIENGFSSQLLMFYKFNCRDNHTMVSRQYSSIDIIHYILPFIDKGNKDASYCHLLTLKNLQMVHHARTIFYFVNCILDRFHISIFQISNSEELQDMYELNIQFERRN